MDRSIAIAIDWPILACAGPVWTPGAACVFARHLMFMLHRLMCVPLVAFQSVHRHSIVAAFDPTRTTAPHPYCIVDASVDTLTIPPHPSFLSVDWFSH